MILHGKELCTDRSVNLPYVINIKLILKPNPAQTKCDAGNIIMHIFGKGIPVWVSEQNK